MSNNIEIQSGATINVNVPDKDAITLSTADQTKTNISISGAKSIGNSDVDYIHAQEMVSTLWEINHNAGKYPSVTVVDSGGNVLITEIRYIDKNNLEVRFENSTSGKAYLN